MSATVWLVRHASTAWTGRRWCGTTDVPLSSTGRAEAATLAERLSALIPVETDLASAPSRRATETAAALAGAADLGTRIDARLREVDFGHAEGLTWDRLERRLPLVAERIMAGEALVDWPGGESASDTRARILDIWSSLDRATGHVVLVTHGGLILGLLSHIVEGRPVPGSVPPASTTMLRREGSRWCVRPVGAES